MKFRKKPVVIEAVQYNGDNWASIINWAEDGLPMLANSIISRDLGRTLSIRTLEGRLTAFIGDWIIKGIKGEFYPIKDDIFRATYEPVPPPTRGD